METIGVIGVSSESLCRNLVGVGLSPEPREILQQATCDCPKASE